MTTQSEEQPSTELATREYASRIAKAGTKERLTAEQIQFIATTEFVPRGYRGRVPAIMACIAYGRELGFGDMESLQTIHVIDGRPGLSAGAMVALVRKHGHSIVGTFGPDTVTAKGRRKDNGDEIEVTWTREMAERAKLIAKDNWQNYPEAMLWARAVSQLCRMLFTDCLSGLVYTPDELELSDEDRVIEQLRPGLPLDHEGPDDSGFGGESVAAAEAQPSGEAEDDAVPGSDAAEPLPAENYWETEEGKAFAAWVAEAGGPHPSTMEEAELENVRALWLENRDDTPAPE